MMSAAPAGIPAKGVIAIQINNEAREILRVDLSVADGYIFGRSDSKSSYLPDIDLAALQGLEKGVSRRHAALCRYREHLHVLDLGSVNGTFLNGERLAPEIPYPLSSGDQLLLGNLLLQVSYLER